MNLMQFIRLVCFPLIYLAFITVLVVPASDSVADGTQDAAHGTPLRVALFPWVPDLDRMEAVIREHWSKVSATPIEFVSWDAYEGDPPESLDVFEYDAIFLAHFVRENFVSPLEAEDIEYLDDILPFALRGSMMDGFVYGIPRLACTPIIMYRRGDSAVEKVKSIDDLVRTLDVAPGTTPKPGPNKGLLIDFTGGTSCACYYLDAVADSYGRYTVEPHLPGPDGLQSEALQNLRKLTRMAGRPQVLYKDQDHDRAAWFGSGLGRAYVGYTEELAYIPHSAHSTVGVRGLPLAADNRVNLFFVDILSISPALAGERRQLAIKLANLCASGDTVTACFLPKEDGQSAQYLLPVRNSVLDSPVLRAKAPLYADLATILRGNPRAFRIGVEVRDWLDSTKKAIRDEITHCPISRN